MCFVFLSFVFIIGLNRLFNVLDIFGDLFENIGL